MPNTYNNNNCSKKNSCFVSYSLSKWLNILKALVIFPAVQKVVNRYKIYGRTSLLAHTVKSVSAMQEAWVWSLGQEDLLEKEMATHSSILAWKIPWTEKPGGPQSVGSQRVRQDRVINTSTIKYIGNVVIIW